MDFNKKMAKANETKAAVKANEIKSTAKETVTTAKNVVKETAAETKANVSAKVEETKAAVGAKVEEKKAVVAKEVTEKKEAVKAAKPEKEKKLAKAAKEVKEELKPEVFVQYQGREAVIADVVEKAKGEFVAAGHRVSSIKSLQVYLKPEDYSAYYVINQKFAGRVDLF